MQNVPIDKKQWRTTKELPGTLKLSIIILNKR